jgi:hypothetical protein
MIRSFVHLTGKSFAWLLLGSFLVAALPACVENSSTHRPGAQMTNAAATPPPSKDTTAPRPEGAQPPAAEPKPETDPAFKPSNEKILAKSQAEGLAHAPAPAIQGAQQRQARVKSASAVLYKAPSSQSAKVATNLAADETVTVIERQYGSSVDEIILYHEMPAYTTPARSGEPAATLPSGTTVRIERFDKGNETYYVRYEHPQKGRLYGAVTASQLETLNYSYWFRIRRANGQEGWVPGRFLNVN